MRWVDYSMKPLEILYEDNHIIVCVKPPGVLSQSGKKQLDDMLTLLKEHIKIKYQKPGDVFLGLVHRLDLNVGGVMVFARTSKAASRLSASIRNKEFKKTYLAMVEGEIVEPNFIDIVDYLEKNTETRTGSVSDISSGKEAILSYKTLALSNLAKMPVSLLEVELKTGRFHQIRIQFSSRNHPLFGDKKYGAKIDCDNSQIGLWAYRLIFPHPTTRENMVFLSYPANGCFKCFKEFLNTNI